MKKMLTVFSLLAMAMLLFAGVASAHVVVSPAQTTQGAYEMFTMRVPTEGQAATVKIEVKIPADVEVSRVEPKPGWKYEFVKDASGKVTSLIWTADGPGLSPTEFGDFKMQGKVGAQATSLSWKAYQTFSDNSVAEWVGAPDADKPASVTTVVPKPASAASDSHGATSAETEAAAAKQSSLPLYLSIAALVLAVLAVLAAFMRKAR